MKGDIKDTYPKVPIIDPLINNHFLQWIHDDCFIIVGENRYDDFHPPTSIVSMYFKVSYYLRNVWSYKKPCFALNLYPLDLEDHWFGFHMDYTGLAFPVQYKKPVNNKAGERTIVTVCGRWSFEWIHGDKGLVASFLLPMLIIEMLAASRFELRRDYGNDEWTTMMEDFKSYNLELLKSLIAVQELKTKSVREKHIFKLSCNSLMY